MGAGTVSASRERAASGAITRAGLPNTCCRAATFRMTTVPGPIELHVADVQALADGGVQADVAALLESNLAGDVRAGRHGARTVRRMQSCPIVAFRFTVVCSPMYVS